MGSTSDITRKSDQVLVRLPDGLRDRLQTMAKANRRSANSEIVVHLEQAAERFDAERQSQAAE